MQIAPHTIATLTLASLLLAAAPAGAQVPARPSPNAIPDRSRVRPAPPVRAATPVLAQESRTQEDEEREREERERKEREEREAAAESDRARPTQIAPPASRQPRAQPVQPVQPAPPPQTNEQRRQSARQEGRFQLDFNGAEIADVVQTISDFTGRLFIVPDNIRGKITIVGPEDGTGLVTADEAYAAFLSALEANNWTVYPVGAYLKLVEKRAAGTANVWTYVESGSRTPADERVVTKIIRLDHITTDAVANPLKQLMSKDATVIPFPPDTLIVTEVSLNLRRIERILASLDQPGGGEEMQVIQVEYATAAEIADKVMQVFDSQGGTSAARPTPRGRSTPATRAAAAAAAEEEAGGGASISRVIPDERTNKLIVMANRKGFEQIEALIRQLDVPTGDTGRINVYYLANANAEDLASTLQTLTQGQTPQQSTRPATRRRAADQTNDIAELFSGEVKISADTATNSLVVVASAPDYKNLVHVIEQLDIPRRQVFVEAVIMEVNLRDTTDFGFNFHGGSTVDTASGIAPIIVGNQIGPASSLNLSSLVSMGGFLAGMQGPPISAAAELGVALPSFGVVMHALTNSSDVNVLSTPHILTSDNEEAEITVGQNVPFQAGYAPQGLGNLLGGATGGNNVANNLIGSGLGFGGIGSLYAPIQRQNVELKLKIKPQINESDYVRLEVDEQTEEIAEQDPTLGPTTARRTAKTVVVAKDQTTVVIGGLIQERTIKSVSKTPILGDIPVVGWLFRDNSTTKAKTNLLLFLTPYIIRDQSDFRRIFERKMKERDEFIAAFYGRSDEYEVHVDFARKAGPLALLSKDLEEEMLRIENGGPGAPGQRRITPTRQNLNRQRNPQSPWTNPPPPPAEEAPTEAPTEAPQTAPPADAQEAPADETDEGDES